MEENQLEQTEQLEESLSDDALEDDFELDEDIENLPV